MKSFPPPPPRENRGTRFNESLLRDQVRKNGSNSSIPWTNHRNVLSMHDYFPRINPLSLGSSIYPFEFSTLESHSSLDCERSWFKRILIKCSALPLEDPIRLNSSLNSWAHVSHASFDPNICPRGKRRLFENFSIDSRGSIETFRAFFFLSVILPRIYRYSLKFFSRSMFHISLNSPPSFWMIRNESMLEIIGKRLGGLMLVNLEIRGEIKIENVELKQLRTGLIVFLCSYFCLRSL